MSFFILVDYDRRVGFLRFLTSKCAISVLPI